MQKITLLEKKAQRLDLLTKAIASYSFAFFFETNWSKAHTPLLSQLSPDWIKVRKNAPHYVNETYWRLHTHLLRPMTFGAIPDDKVSQSVASVGDDYPEDAKNISVFKILSGTELAFTYASPIGLIDGGSEVDTVEMTHLTGLLNAHLGFYCALHLLAKWPKYRKILTNDRIIALIKLDPLIKDAPGEYSLGLLDEHLRFLISAKPESNLPVMGNAIWWRLFAGRLYTEL